MRFAFPLFLPRRRRPVLSFSGSFAVIATAVLPVLGAGAPARAQQPPSPNQPALPGTVSPAAAAAPLASAERDTFTVRGAADLRVRETDKEGDRSYIAATRLTSDWIRRGGKTGARAQFYLENQGERDTNGGSRLRASELWVSREIRLPALAEPARLTVGQFPIPFGLTALYDPLQPIQPLYEKALGVRVDTGVRLDGDYGVYRYSVAATTGAGPLLRTGYRAGGAVTFRLERTVETELGRFVVGGSLLSGRLPVTGANSQLPASGTVENRYSLVNKTRFAADGQYLFGPVVLRGEVMFGGDGPNAAWGYFAEGNYRAADRLTLVAMRRLWNFADSIQVASSTGLGANYDVGRGLTVRALYEFQRDVDLPAGTAPRVAKRLTLQTRLNF